MNEGLSVNTNDSLNEKNHIFESIMTKITPKI
jgi:hypothetical protein